MSAVADVTDTVCCSLFKYCMHLQMYIRHSIFHVFPKSVVELPALQLVASENRCPSGAAIFGRKLYMLIDAATLRMPATSSTCLGAS